MSSKNLQKYNFSKKYGGAMHCASTMHCTPIKKSKIIKYYFTNLTVPSLVLTV